ncbi:Calcium/calmodulin-dependent 3',5'-cyclic nucleotide phosphodiesterase 1C [Merluccius polli]|uniref:Calcium/calmodulin-dependent 3',5'-cyclic nucleotide phosphodiesterase 1C n=1 Tax=Merluccius polli TaxID=89951 RepID=A0AA47NB99_MERPO|nr:Calcium/calmodulin-dependent 3',5'-cyclic nucleotide phosphodiesterase 1C [Merluccius polli]
MSLCKRLSISTVLSINCQVVILHKHWLTELEILAMIFAAAVHDYEHTGTTNNFHIQTRSDTAILYNDRAVLENHHVSAAYRLLQDDDEMNIFYNLSKDDWRELRALVVEMVLATDMSCHFQQIKAMKNFLQQPEAIDKPKALSLLLHTADISHPAKQWDLHHRWTTSLLEEFFRQLSPKYIQPEVSFASQAHGSQLELLVTYDKLHLTAVLEADQWMCRPPGN